MFVEDRDVVGWERMETAFHTFAWCENAFPPLFALIQVLEDAGLNDYFKTWLRSHRCAIDMQIRNASQKSRVKREDPV